MQKLHTWVILISWHFFEAVIKGQVVSDRVLPARFALVVEREIISDVLINLTQRQSLVWCSMDSHSDESRVGVRGAYQLHQIFL